MFFCWHKILLILKRNIYFAVDVTQKDPLGFHVTPDVCGEKILTLNPLALNDLYIRRTAQLTSRRCISNIYSTNILTEYFKHAAHSPFYPLQDAVYFVMLSLLVPVIFTF